jgi:hypothetical protein
MSSKTFMVKRTCPTTQKGIAKFDPIHFNKNFIKVMLNI